MIVAHRGNSAEFRENSLPAIRSALEIGVKFVEFDVHLSSDGVPVLSHDVTLDRMFGVAANVMDTHSDELRRFGLAALADAMALVRTYSATAFVDLKPESIDRFSHIAIDQVMKHAQDHVLVSWDLPSLLFARRKYCARIGLIVPDLTSRTRQIVAASHPEFLFCDQLRINKKLWPAQWVAYEVESTKMMERLKGYGVSYFETKRVRELCSQ